MVNKRNLAYSKRSNKTHQRKEDLQKAPERWVTGFCCYFPETKKSRYDWFTEGKEEAKGQHFVAIKRLWYDEEVLAYDDREQAIVAAKALTEIMVKYNIGVVACIRSTHVGSPEKV